MGGKVEERRSGWRNVWGGMMGGRGRRKGRSKGGKGEQNELTN